MLARVEFPRLRESGEVQLRASFGWYESVTYTHAGQTRALRIDEMMNAVWEFVRDAVIQMHIARRMERGDVDPAEAKAAPESW